MRRSLVLLALLVGRATRLPAQSPADRAALEALRDSLARATDSLSLKRLEAATIQVAKRNRDDPLIHLRLGFIAYRLGEITNHKAHDDDAAGEFEWATQLKPDWPYPWYGRGLADLAQGEHAVIAIENIRAILGKDYLSKAAQAFARATQVDPSFAEAAMDVANTALSQRIQPRLQAAALLVAPGRRRGAQPGGTARGALSPLVLRLAQLPAGEPAPALRHHRALSVRPGRVRRPRHHLSAPRPARQGRHVSMGAGAPRAERDVAVSRARWRSRLPLRSARGRAGLQAGGEPGRRADGRIRRGAGAPGAARPARPHDERAVRVAPRHQSDRESTRLNS